MLSSGGVLCVGCRREGRKAQLEKNSWLGCSTKAFLLLFAPTKQAVFDWLN